MAHFLDPQFIIKAVGLVGILGIIFAESGFFVGFFLPGDSLLFTAGFLASVGYINFWLLLIGAPLCAIVGDSVGYAFGRKVGPTLFSREDSRFFHKRHLERARIFYEQHGRKTIVLARFVPVVRTFAPIVAGAGQMHYPTFLTYNVLGGVIWSVGLTLLGFWLGRIIPDVDQYLLPVILVIIALSFLPIIVEIWKSKRRKV